MGEQPTVDLVLGYHKANGSPMLRKFLSKIDDAIVECTGKKRNRAASLTNNVISQARRLEDELRSVFTGGLQLVEGVDVRSGSRLCENVHARERRRSVFSVVFS